MPQPDWDALEGEVRSLAQRVGRIEQELGLRAPTTQPAATGETAGTPTTLLESPAALLPVLGRALLGLAGAYLLRAVTENGTLPPELGVAIGLGYAILWLVWAARTPAQRRLEAALHSLVAVLVLGPLLWEAVLRFHALSTWMAGALLLFFTVFGLAVSWRKNLLLVATVSTLAGLGTAGALLMATHDVLPFSLVFLAIAAAVEASACLDHWLSERWLAATAADLAVLLATWLVTNERGLPAVYAPIPHAWLLAAQAGLLAIYLSSTIVRTLLRGFRFTNFETAQWVLAFVISVSGGLRVAAADPRFASVVAFLILACAAACYLVAFTMLDRDSTHGRNFYTYSTFGLLLALVGSRILLAGAAGDAVWSALAIAGVWAGGHFGRLTLQVHGGVYLLLALVSSGALRESAVLLLDSGTWPGENGTAVEAGIVAVGICYALAIHYGRERLQWDVQLFRLGTTSIFALLLAGAAAGLTTAAYHAVFGESASHAYCATLRTGIVAAAALVMAWAGSRWNVPEWSRLIYPAMAAGAYRLVMEDLHQERTTALFLSLLVYGIALMALPRFKRSAA